MTYKTQTHADVILETFSQVFVTKELFLGRNFNKIFNIRRDSRTPVRHPFSFGLIYILLGNRSRDRQFELMHPGCLANSAKQ